MFRFSDPEGEVDHSFFDSDCDTNHVSRGEKVEEGLKAGEGSPSAHQRLHAQQTENVKGSWSQSRDATKKHLKLVKKNRGGREKKKESSRQSEEEELSRASSISSVSCISGRVIKNFSDGDEESDLHSERPSGAIMALLADAKEVECEDVRRGQNPNKSKEESLPSISKHLGSKGKNKQSSKKWIRNRHTRIPSSVSAEASIDADSESSCSISNAGSKTNSPTLPRPMKSSSPGVRRSRVGSVGTWEAARHTEESDNTVTYVSPLSSPDISPLQSLDLNHTEAEEGSLKEQQQESVISSGLCHINQREDSDQDEDDEFEDAKAKLGALRVTYVIKKTEEQETRGGQAGTQKKKWKYMDAMPFQKRSTALRRENTNPDQLEQEEEHEEAGQEQSEERKREMTARTAQQSTAKASKKKGRDFREQNFKRKEQQRARECSLHSESWLRGKLTPYCPGGKNRKNYSFTNNEVQTIDLQNQRLLRKLSSLSAGPRPGSLAGKKTSVTSNSPIVRLSHSGLNRQREHQRINRENLAFLKRLESVKPTPSLKRSEQLADYQKLCSYPIAVSTKKQGRSTSMTPSGLAYPVNQSYQQMGSRPVSSAEHSLRAVSTTTISCYTHVPRSKKLNAARPAWC